MRTLDFNAIEQPTFDVTMRDKGKTVLRLTIPTEELVERLAASAKELKAIVEKKDAHSVKKCYALAAELFSCNADLVSVTGEELRNRYRISITDLVAFFVSYIEFINEIRNTKN
jgi:hypothetical protein